MVPPRRRQAQRVSYREFSEPEEDESQDDSFDESHDDDVASPAPVPPRTSRHTRRRPPAHTTAAGSSTSVQTRRQPRKTYAEDFSDSEENDSDFMSDQRMEVDGDAEVEGEVAVVQSGRATAAKPRGRPAKKASSTTVTPRKTTQRRTWVESSPLPLPSFRKAEPPKPKGPSQADLWRMGSPCPWTDLPFEILRDILSYASYPLFDDNGWATPHVQWLLKFRNIHPALLEASLAVLYYCPPLMNATTAHKFLTLMVQEEGRSVNYNVKVRHLELEARNTLAYSAGVELGPVDLGLLVGQLPQLLGIDVWTVLDNPEIRRKALTSRAWSYPDTLFAALKEGKQRLRHFHWNARFMGKQAADPLGMYTWMNSVHLFPSFQSLTYLKLTSFLGDSDSRIDLFFPVDYETPGKPLTVTQQNKEAVRLEKKAMQRKQDEELAKAVEALPNLRKLDLHMCSVVDGAWLQLLPINLTHLGIIECDRLSSDDLEEFLASRGGQLEVLVLNHNPALNVAFLTSLAQHCPSLQELVMDLTYFRKLATVNGAEEPAYESLLLPDQKPTWPRTLRTISMNHLHHWSASAAELFFTSLIECAEHLPDLRRLLLSVSLDVSWRERAKMRDMWEERFKRVFLRNAAPPNPNWWSIKSFREWKGKKVPEVLVSPPKLGDGRVSRVIDQPVEETEEDDEDEDDDDGPVGVRKRKAPAAKTSTRRLRPRKTASDDEQTNDSEPISALGTNLRDMVMRTLERHVQGLCDEVDVRIDNLRPREEQFHEADFLDSEPSGDEEWDGVDLDEDELYGGKKGSRGGRRKNAW